MTRKRLFVHSVFLLLLPIIVAWFGVGVFTAALFVVLMLLWRWLIVLSGIIAPEESPEVVLDTIALSHYVEKVRWCLDRLGVDYTERQSGGTLGAFFAGRTVPRLRVRTGIVQTSVGNSPDILRYLWGRYSSPLGEAAAFLEPTPERLQLEKKLDRYGRFLQVWFYALALQDREFTLHAWGVDSPRTPAWQRLALRALFPVLAILIRRSFAITDAHYARAATAVDELLGEIDLLLADGRRSILGGDTINYTDLAFAAFSGLWTRSENYGGGMADDSLIQADKMPAAMRADTERWNEDHPKAVGLVQQLYAQER